MQHCFLFHCNSSSAEIYTVRLDVRCGKIICVSYAITLPICYSTHHFSANERQDEWFANQLHALCQLKTATTTVDPGCICWFQTWDEQVKSYIAFLCGVGHSLVQHHKLSGSYSKNKGCVFAF